MNKLKNKNGEMVTEWMKMSGKKWAEFVEANKDLTYQALQSKMLLDIKQIKQNIEEQENMRKGNWMTESQLKSAGYTESHIANILANCTSEWDSEISELRAHTYAHANAKIATYT